jgi:hypothetical protein
VLYCRTPDASELSKAAEQKPVDVMVTSPMATASAPPSLAGACLMACTYNDTRSSAQWVLGYLESLKNVEADQKGNRSDLTALDSSFFSDHISRICVALSSKLEEANKALDKLKAA